MPQRPIRDIIAGQTILSASAQTTVSEAARLMRDCKVGALMVVEEAGRLVGIFTERDALFRVLGEKRDPQTTRLAEVMTRDPQTVDPDKPLGHALHMMYEGGFRHVPVVESGLPLGIVSVRDALGPEMEEFESDLQRREHLREVL